MTLRRLAVFVLLLLAWATAAEAALAHVQHANSGDDTDANTTVVTTAFGASVTAGNTMLCSVTWETTTIVVTGVTNGTDVLTSAGGPHTHTANTFSQQYWYKFNITSSSTTAFTATFDSGPSRALMNCAEISGPPITPINAGPSANEQSNVGTGADAVVSPSITPNIDGCYVHSTMAAPDNNNTVNIGSNPIAWTGAGAPSVTKMRLEYFVQTTAAAIQATWTNTASTTDNLTTIIALCPAGVGGGGRPSIIGGGVF